MTKPNHRLDDEGNPIHNRDCVYSGNKKCLYRGAGCFLSNVSHAYGSPCVPGLIWQRDELRKENEDLKKERDMDKISDMLAGKRS